MDTKDKMVAKFFEAIIFGNGEAMAEAKKLAHEIDEEEKRKYKEEIEKESEEKINARFLRGKQDEIDNLRKEVERLEYKAKRYSDQLLESFDKIKELETDLGHRDSILSKAYDLIAYPGLSDTKKIDILRKVINIEVGASYEPDEDVTNFHKRIYKCKKGPQGATGISN